MLSKRGAIGQGIAIAFVGDTQHFQHARAGA